MSARTRAQDADEPLLSAQVVLKTIGGAKAESITAANVASLVPPLAVVAQVRAWFQQRKFEVGDAVALSFSITAPPAVFETVFGKLPRGRTGRIDIGRGGRGYELPLRPLGALARHVEAVVFPPPPDFGPIPGGF